ncbi:hypothetical protein PanWU01x14_315510, partial [Parasponia andersonii]
MVNPPNPPTLSPRLSLPPPVPLASSEGFAQHNQLGEPLAMMRSLEQEVVTLKNRKEVQIENGAISFKAALFVHNGASTSAALAGASNVM